MAPTKAVVAWVSAIGVAVVLLALTSDWHDPIQPNWPVGLVLGVSAVEGTLAIWTRRGSFVYCSALLLNFAGYFLWAAWAKKLGADGDVLNIMEHRFVLVQIVCLALASLLWSGIELGIARLTAKFKRAGPMPPFRHAAAWLALLALAVMAARSVAFHLASGPYPPADPFIWYALVVALAAALATLWDQPDARWASPWQQVYFLGLTAIGIGLTWKQLEPRWLLFDILVTSGPYVLLTALACAAALRYPRFADKIGIPRRLMGWPLTWFGIAQTVLGAVVLALGVWVNLVFAEFGERLAGVLAVACLGAAGFVLTPHWPRVAPRGNGLDLGWPRLGTLLLGVVACVLLHVAFVGPDDTAPWLHRTVLAMAAVTWMCAAYGLALPRWLAPENGWALAGRRLSLPLAATACTLLLGVLVQEFVLYNPAEDVRPSATRALGRGAGVGRAGCPHCRRPDLRAEEALIKRLKKRGQAPLCEAPFGPFRQRGLSPFFQTGRPMFMPPRS